MRRTGCPRGQPWPGVSPNRAQLTATHASHGLSARTTLARREPESGATDGDACVARLAWEDTRGDSEQAMPA